jgi:RNA polymerase sigma-70 factor (ECF subfamily)
MSLKQSDNAALDRETIRRVIEGDANAFEDLIERYRSLVFGISAKHVPLDHLDDVAQEAFLEAFRSLESYAGKAPFSHWLSRITIRCCYSFWRQQKGNREIPMSSISEDSENWLEGILSADSRERFDQESERKEAAEVLSYALSRVSAEDRMVLTLVHLDGYSVKEAAELLGWSVITVKVRAHRSRNKLRKIITDLLEGRRSGV